MQLKELLDVAEKRLLPSFSLKKLQLATLECAGTPSLGATFRFRPETCLADSNKRVSVGTALQCEALLMHPQIVTDCCSFA